VGITFGFGHGGIEAIIVGLIALIVFFQAIALQNVDPSTINGNNAAFAQQFLSGYWTIPWYQHFLSLLERLWALSLHVSAAILVLQALVRKNLLWLFIAILWHALVDAYAVFGVQTWGAIPLELSGILLAALSILIIFLLRPSSHTPDMNTIPREESPTRSRRIPDEVQITKKKLEDSRYDG
jgi:uncharacterized membrane protein YhfC